MFEIVEPVLRLVPEITLLNVNIVTLFVPGVAEPGTVLTFGVVIVVFAGSVNVNVLSTNDVEVVYPPGLVDGIISKLYPLIITPGVVPVVKGKAGACVTVLITLELFVFP